MRSLSRLTSPSLQPVPLAFTVHLQPSFPFHHFFAVNFFFRPLLDFSVLSFPRFHATSCVPTPYPCFSPLVRRHSFLNEFPEHTVVHSGETEMKGAAFL